MRPAAGAMVGPVSPPSTTVACWACGAPAARDDRLPAPGLFACATCGLRFTPGVDADEVRDLYDQSYFEDYGGEVYSEAPEQRRYEADKRLRYLTRFVPGGTLLEIGVAGGWFLDAARRDGFAVRGIEPAAEMSEEARRRFGLEVVTAFVEDVPLAPASLDAVCAWHVLEHIPDPLPTLMQLRSALRPGGGLAIEVPNTGGRQAQRMGADWPHWDFAHHVAHYAPPSVRVLLERAGFEDVEIETIHGADYHRPSVALRPAMVAAAARFALTGGGLPRRPHPSDKEMLRAVGRVRASG